MKNGIAWAWSFAKLVYDIAISGIEHFPQTTFWTGLGLVILGFWF